ncbi:MAG TPA: SCO family protein [Vicinamibacterales bacterium]|nr:SCO family protein [Vicinamibacterales bacterium]
MRLTWVPLLFAVALTGCSRTPDARTYELQGQILAVRPERNEVVIKHEDIKGFMPGMTMPFTVKDPALLNGRERGDLVTATLVVGETQAYLTTLTRTGHQAVADPPPPPPPDILSAGQPVKDAPLVDQDDRPRAFSSFKGHRLAVTFIYTRCPIPNFCPLMDKHFAAVQKTIAATPSLADVRLVTVTLDPAFDRPAILKAYAKRREADPALWTFLTGEPAVVNTFATQFGLYVEHNPQNPIDITHNLRTAVIDPEGRLVTIHNGNSWTPAELVADLSAAPAPAN